MSFSDSQAVFASRAREIGLTQAVLDSLVREGLDTMASFAFCCNYSPGAGDDKPFTVLMEKILTRAPTVKEMSGLRRLFNEAYASVASEMKNQVEAADDGAIRKLAPAERAQRLRAQQARLLGLNLKGPYEPSDSLVDRANSLYESGRLAYVEWTACTSRDHEIATGSKKNPGVTMDSSGVLRMSKKEGYDPASTSNEIQIRYCLVRRGLALEQANLLSYANHDRLTEKLMQYRLEDPPPGFARISLQQLEAADKRFWQVIAEATRDGIKTTVAGRPLDLKFEACLTSMEFLAVLAHRPQGNQARASGSDENPLKCPGSGRRLLREGGARARAKVSPPASRIARMCSHDPKRPPTVLQF